jgi:hypothetical protein
MEDITYINEISVADYNMLRLSAGWTEIEESQALTGLQNTRYLVVAKHENKTVGMVRWITDGGYESLFLKSSVHLCLVML